VGRKDLNLCTTGLLAGCNSRVNGLAVCYYNMGLAGWHVELWHTAG
jgi:hypothetical protein